MIANEGLHWWLFLFRYSHPYWGSSRRIHTSSLGLSELLVAGGHAFTWLVTVLCQWAVFSWPTRLLRYADLLHLWLCAHSLLDQGVRGLFACPSPSSLLWFCKFRWVLFSAMVHTLRDGVTPAGSRLVCPRSERRFSVFSLSLWAVSSCCPCPSG